MGEFTVIDESPERWVFTPEGIPVNDITTPVDGVPETLDELLSDEPLDPEGHSFLIYTLVGKLDLAIARGDRLAVAVIETTLGFGYADRFQREF